MTYKHAVFVAAMFALMGSAFADQMVMKVATDKASFEASKARLTSQLESDKYSDIAPADKHTVLATLDRIDARLSKVVSSDQLDEQDRVDMFNDQEIINTIVTHAAVDSRMICTRETTLGSRRPKVICMTIAIKKAREKAGQDAMDAIDHRGNKNEMRRR